MTVAEIMKELEAMGNDATKNTFLKHGAQEPFFGVKVGDLKKIQKKVKKNHELSLALYETGNSDAMYLAGLIADEKEISKADLQKWVEAAGWYMISEYTVAWIAAESNYGYELALEWIESNQESIASSGWATLGSLALIKPDDELDIAAFQKLLDRVGETVHNAANRVRYTMNGFVISVGSGITPLSAHAAKVAEKIGKVSVDVGGTACKVPLATDYIQKVVDKGRLGKKKKMARC